MSVYSVNKYPTDLKRNQININDLNKPTTHLNMLLYDITEIDFDLDLEGVSEFKLDDGLSEMHTKYAYRFYNADKCTFSVKSLYPLFVGVIPQDILGFCIGRGYTVQRMVKRYALL